MNCRRKRDVRISKLIKNKKGNKATDLLALGRDNFSGTFPDNRGHESRPGLLDAAGPGFARRCGG